MILIGMYDSPFVRRVGIALRLYGIAYEHRAWSVFSDTMKIMAYNPLVRVPTLVLDDGEALIDSAAILDALDDLVGPERAMTPSNGPPRRAALKTCALAAGIADKAVSLVYERHVHERADPVWIERCAGQITRVMNELEIALAAQTTHFWRGDAIGHDDVMVSCAVTFMRDALAGDMDLAPWQALKRHTDMCEGLPEFRESYMKFKIG
ncbi:glutathione S-transferase family protein [Hyphomonas sp.]|uniref:glutathione S-transferase family protein n=1 Tax=Hyphomonas sp. TaxID=87 RepID=UPI003562D2B1